MTRVPTPKDHNDTTERFKRSQEYGWFDDDEWAPSKLEVAMLGVTLFLCIVGFVAMVMRIIGLI